MCFVSNSTIQRHDLLGLELEEDCTLLIRENHGITGPSGNLAHFNRLKNSRPGRCSGIMYLGCGANELNRALRDESIGISGSPVNDYYPDPEKDLGGKKPEDLGFEPNDFQPFDQVPDDLDAAVEAARRDAPSRCACCEEVIVKVDCGEAQRRQEVAYRTRGDLKCGETFTYDCASRTWR